MAKRPTTKRRPLFAVGSRVTKIAAFTGGSVETVQITSVRAVKSDEFLYKVLGTAKGVFGAPTRFTFEHELKLLATAYESALPVGRAA